MSHVWLACCLCPCSSPPPPPCHVFNHRDRTCSDVITLQDDGARDRALSTMASMSSAQIVSATAMQQKMPAGATSTASNVAMVAPTSIKQQPPSPNATTVSSPVTTNCSLSFLTNTSYTDICCFFRVFKFDSVALVRLNLINLIINADDILQAGIDLEFEYLRAIYV